LVEQGSSSPSRHTSVSSQATTDGSVLDNFLFPKTAVQIPRQRKTAILTSTPVKEMIEKVKEKTFEKVKKKLFA
jgi:hypothetical protein